MSSPLTQLERGLPHQKELRRLVAQILGLNSPDVEDVLQEVHLTAWEYARTNQIVHLRQFLRRAARNKALDVLRKNQKQYLIQGDALDVAVSSEQERDLRLRKLEARLRKLTPKQESVVRLVYFDGLTQEEAAERLGISQQAAAKLVQRAWRALRKEHSE